MPRAAAVALATLALALLAALLPPAASADGPCPLPGFVPLVAGQEGFVPIDQACPPEADRDPSFYEVTVHFGDGTSTVTTFQDATWYVGAPHTYAQPGTYQATGTVRDKRTGATLTYRSTIHVEAPPAPPTPPAPPAATPRSTPCSIATPALPPMYAGTRGFVFLAQHCPPEADRNVANFTVRIDFGDGTSGPAQLRPDAWIVGAEHTYRRAGTYTATAVVRDVRTGAEATYVRQISIASRELAAERVAKPRFTVGRKGRARTLVAFTDPTPRAAARDYRAVIRWGDGRRSRGKVRRTEAGRFEVLGRHRYRKMRNRRLRVVVTDAQGEKHVLRTTALVGRVYDKLPR